MAKNAPDELLVAERGLEAEALRADADRPQGRTSCTLPPPSFAASRRREPLPR